MNNRTPAQDAEIAGIVSPLKAEIALLKKAKSRKTCQLDRLREDKARLDYLLTVAGSAWAYGFLRNFEKLDRHGIDAARKAKP